MTDTQVMESPVYLRLQTYSGLAQEDVLPIAREALDRMWLLLHPEWTPPKKILDFRGLMLRTIFDYIRAEKERIIDGFDVPPFAIPADKQLDASLLFEVVTKDLADVASRNLQEPWKALPSEVGINTRRESDDEPAVRR